MTYIPGKTVLVTGAAKGLGREMARCFAARGARLVLVDRDGTGIEALADELRGRGGRADALACDLSSEDRIAELADRVAAEVGPIEILVNNAGVVAGGSYERVPADGDRAMLAVNVAAVHWLTKRFLPVLKRAESAHIVQMASAAGFIGIPYQAVYCASKWFVIGLSEAIRQELRQDGATHVRVTIVCPSLVDTGMFDGARAPLLTPYLRAEPFAERIVRAVERDRLYLRAPFMVRLAPVLQAVLPRPLLDLISDRLRVGGLMAGFRGREAP